MILVTGGAGFIGSHTCIELISSGYDILIVDDFSNSKPEIVDKIGLIAGKKVRCIHADATDKAMLKRIFNENKIDAVIHFAGFKAVGESVEKPLLYYKNNIDSTLALCETMQEYGVKKFIFSSSATVYRSDNKMPLDEDSSLGCTNPYGWTKYMIEQILRDICVSDKEWAVALLRYFNPIGAHKSGLIGEDPNGIPNNLMPYITRVASGKLEELHVFGNDYPTPDGTGIRDYIHVVDLAKGHVSALNYVNKNTGIEAFNLGTGRGYSVLEVIKAFEKASGKKLTYVIDGRRAGDIAVCFAKTDKSKKILNWEAKLNLDDMCTDSWRWELNRK
ncbi:MAG: UDP-glucose 4-epimerase GalE [Eubacteriales bacterium]